MSQLTPVFVRIDREVKQALQVFCIYDSRYTMSGVVEEAVKDFLKRNEPPNKPRFLPFKNAA